MANPLFSKLNQYSSFTPGGGNQPMNNMMNFMGQFQQFKNNFQGDPKAQVQQLLNSGRMSQEQFNQLSNMASQFQRMMGR